MIKFNTLDYINVYAHRLFIIALLWYQRISNNNFLGCKLLSSIFTFFVIDIFFLEIIE